MKCLVTAVDPSGRILDYPVHGMRHQVFQFRTNPVNFDEALDFGRAAKLVDSVFCEEDDVDLVVETMTGSFPGVDIYVYTVQSISVRAPGELKTKAITKDGVLPT